jgi:hypothetical protein
VQLAEQEKDHAVTRHTLPIKERAIIEERMNQIASAHPM